MPQQVPQPGYAQAQPAPIPQPKICPVCKGAGRVQQQVQSFFGTMTQIRDCPACKGRGTVIKMGNGAAITGLIFSIIATILFMILPSFDTNPSRTETASEVYDSCTGWMVMFWLGLALLVTAWILFIVCLVKKNRSKLVIVSIVIASIATIMFFVSCGKYSDVSDLKDIAEMYKRWG